MIGRTNAVVGSGGQRFDIIDDTGSGIQSTAVGGEIVSTFVETNPVGEAFRITDPAGNAIPWATSVAEPLTRAGPVGGTFFYFVMPNSDVRVHRYGS